MKQKLFGFTLIELMIVVAIIGILAAIAYPSYIEHVRRSHRADAQAALTESAQALERYYTKNNSYTNFPNTSLKQPEGGRYAVTVAITATTFTLTATPGTAQAGDVCGTLTLTHTGAQSSSGSGQGCW